MLNTGKNFASSQATAGILVGDLTVTLTTGQGARFPNPGSGSDTSFYVTVYDGVTYANADDDPNREICLVTGRSTDVLTWTRAQQSTSAAAHPSGARIINAFSIADLSLIVAGAGTYAVDTGAANAYVSTPSMYPTSLVAGYQSTFKALNTNTGASTINVGGTGVKTITRTNGATLIAGDILVGQICEVEYDGTNWQLKNPNMGTASPNTISNVSLVGKNNGSGTSVTSITVSSLVATVTQTAHGFATGDWVEIAGATGAGVGDINQLHQITKTGTNTYTFVTTATGSIAGTILNTFWFSGTRTVNASLITSITRTSTGLYVITFKNTQADTYYGIILTAGNSGAGQSGAIVPASQSASITTTALTVSFKDAGGTVRDADIYLFISLTGII